MREEKNVASAAGFYSSLNFNFLGMVELLDWFILISYESEGVAFLLRLLFVYGIFIFIYIFIVVVVCSKIYN